MSSALLHLYLYWRTCLLLSSLGGCGEMRHLVVRSSHPSPDNPPFFKNIQIPIKQANLCYLCVKYKFDF